MQKENNGRKAALQLSSKADAVTFFGVFGGRKTFLLRYRNSDKYCMIEGDKCVVNGTKRFFSHRGPSGAVQGCGGKLPA